ncbi:PIG-L family deacetylase [soil metagenome]
MRFLYIFPHPDDESFGPALAMSAQLRAGHEVHLLTLTRGGATKQRHRLGLSVEEMGEVRYREMQEVARVLELSGMTVLDLPDSGLKEMNPIEIERVVREHIQQLRPEVVVSYAVYGVSAFHDHLVTHAVVKRVYCELQAEGAQYLRRLAMFTLDDSQLGGEDFPFQLQASKPEEIDCVMQVEAADVEAGRRALACYETYQQVIEEVDPLGVIGSHVNFEIFGESYDPPLRDLTERL